MLFKHKLSKRLALSKTARTLLPLAALLGCDAVDHATTAPDAPSVLIITPALHAMDYLDTMRFRASVESGDTAGIPVTWTASGGSISPDGLFTSDTVPGEVTVSARQSDGVLTASTVVIIGASGTISAASASVRPAQVTDLQVAVTQDTVVTLRFTEMDDGTGQPASYDVRLADGRLRWGQAASVTTGTCATPVTGAQIGNERQCTVSGLRAETAYEFQLVAFRGTLNVDAVFGKLSNIAQVTTTPTPVAPGQVTDLGVTGMTTTSATLRFTEVADGAGQAASYDVRAAPAPFSWGSAAGVTTGTCATPLTGTTIGALRNCTVEGLTPGTEYGFQLVAFRGTLDVDATFGSLSNAATAVTASPVTVGSVVVTPGTAARDEGDSAQFTTVVLSTTGDTLRDRAVTWRSADTAVATVSGTGLASARQAGTVTLTATSEGTEGSGVLTVSEPVTAPGQVTTLSVTGTTTTTATVRFTEVSDGAGQPASYDVRVAPTPFNWGSAASVSAGTCASPLAGTSVGAVRTCTVEGLNAGTEYGFQLVAYRGTFNEDAVFGELSNIATATTAGATTTQAWAHEPTGLTALANQPWSHPIPAASEVLINDGWNILWNTAGLTTTVPDATAPYSPDSVIQFLYPLGYISEVHGLGTPYVGIGSRRTVFTGLWWQLSPGWQGHLTGSNKLQYVFTNSNGSITMVAYGPVNGPWEMRVYPQFSTSSDVWLRPNVTNVPLVAGEWYQVEWLLDADAGIIRWWVNGQLVGDYRDEPFPNVPLTEYKLAPVWGGQGDTKTQTDWVRFDHVYLSGR